jgi:spermidine synthase
MNTIDWINGKFEETDIDYKIAGKNILWKYEKEFLSKGVELLCEKLKPKSVLEIGFGLGWTATEFQKQGIQRHVILEANNEIYKKALEWKSQHNTDIEILNIFSWDFETDEKFDLVYDDIQQFSKECNKKHYEQMNKILKDNQWYTNCAVHSSKNMVSKHGIFFKMNDELYIQPLRKYNKHRGIY